MKVPISSAQKAYTMYFKLQIVQELEKGSVSISQLKRVGHTNSNTVFNWLRKLVNKNNRTEDYGSEAKLQLSVKQKPLGIPNKKSIIFDIII